MGKFDTIRRRVLFYTTTAQVRDEYGDLVGADDQAVVWKRLAAMKFADAEGKKGRSRAITESVFEAVDVKPLPGKEPGFYGRFHRTKFADFPIIGKGEEERPLRLENDAGLRHPTHFVWWDLSKHPESKGIPAPRVGLLGIELNIAGPRASALESYVHDRLDGGVVFSVLPLIDPQTWDHIMSQRYVRRMTARVMKPDARKIRGDKLVGLDVPSMLDGVREFSWTVKPRRGEMFDLKKIADRLRGLVTSEEEVSLVVQMPDGQFMDVMESKITGLETVEKAANGTRHVDPTRMYGAIKDAYSKHRGRVARGLGRKVQD